MFENGDIKSIIQLFQSLIADKALLFDKSVDSRKESLLFDWQNVIQNVNDVYTYAFEKWKKSIEKR